MDSLASSSSSHQISQLTPPGYPLFAAGGAVGVIRGYLQACGEQRKIPRKRAAREQRGICCNQWTTLSRLGENNVPAPKVFDD